MNKKIITTLAIALLAAVSASQACNNTCWRNLNKSTLDRLIKRNPVKASRLRPILDAICEQGGPITKQEKRLAKRLHLKKCGGETPAPTPKPKPTPTPTPRPSATPTPRPTPTPSITPPPSPTPTPTPMVGCASTCFWWLCHEDEWCFQLIQIGNHTYSRDQAQTIFEQPANGNGAISLAKWIINTTLNVDCHHSPPDCIRQTMSDANFLIGDRVIPPFGNGFLPPQPNLTAIFLAYTQGQLCAKKCDDIPCPSPTP